MDLLHFQCLAQQDDVGLFASGEAADLLIDAGSFGRGQRRHANGVLQRNVSDLVHRADHVVHSHHGTGQGSGRRPADLAVAGEPRTVRFRSKSIFPWRHVEGSVAIGDQAQTLAAFHSPSKAQ